MPVTVSAGGDKVWLDLGGRKRDVLLTCAAAEAFARGLEGAAALAGAEPPGLFGGEWWGVRVESFDGFVALRFDPPEVGAPGRVPLSVAAARKLAGLVRDKAAWARHKMRLVIRAG